MNNLNHSIFVHQPDPGIKLQNLSGVKLEVLDNSDPLQLYFSNGLSRAKVENGEIHLTLDQLNGTDTSKFKRIYVHNNQQIENLTNVNLQPPIKTITSEKSPTGRKNYQQFYKKVDNKWVCLSCDTCYDSTHGIHYHLNNTICGFGNKERVAAKKDFTRFYTRDNDKFVCLGCSQRYETIRGVHYHLNNKKCGKMTPDQFLMQPVIVNQSLKNETTNEFNGGIKIAVPKRNYLKYYRKEEKTCICESCGARYQSIHGMHNHLNSTKCGFGDKFKSSPKANYTNFYHKVGEKLVCNSCQITYSSMHGMHYHLNSTKCGFGEKDRVMQKRSYQDFYTKEEKSFVCNHCHFKVEYLQGIHRHLRACPGYATFTDHIMSNTPIVKTPKVVKTIVYSDNGNMNYIGHDESL